VLKQEVARVVARFVAVIPPRIEDWDPERVRATVWDLRVDSFGHVGSRLLWDALGVPQAPADFAERARRQIEEVNAADGDAFLRDAEEKTTAATGKKHQRVFAYAEYRLEPPPGDDPELIRGRMLFENGFRSMRSDLKWFKHTPLPVNTWVDRSLCAEMQMMTEFCTQLKKENLAGREEVNELLRGDLFVYTSTPPCVSCVGVLWQFKLYFRHVDLRFVSGSGRSLEAWMRR